MFLLLLGAAYAAYVLGLACVRRGATRGQVLVLAAVIQLAPLAAPLLLSTDAWTYWGYGWTAAAGGGNPYVDPPRLAAAEPGSAGDGGGLDARRRPSTDRPSRSPPSRSPGSPAVTTTSRRGCTRRLPRQPCSPRPSLPPGSPAGLRLPRRSSAGTPCSAIHSAGGGHNDAWVGALLLAALALEGVAPDARRRWRLGSSRSS